MTQNTLQINCILRSIQISPFVYYQNPTNPPYNDRYACFVLSQSHTKLLNLNCSKFLLKISHFL